MSLGEDLGAEAKAIFKEGWGERDGRVIPADADLTLSNECVKLDATVLYADLDNSTGLVDEQSPHFAAEIYKVFLHCAAKIIRSEGGEITAFDGDRVMAVFIGDSKNTSAARCALKLNYARLETITPALDAQYGSGKYAVKHVVGVDTSELHVVKTGVRRANDLVWVGRAANHAAKLCALPAAHPSWITGEVFDRLNASLKTSDGKPMWEEMTWNETGRRVYRSTWWWKVD